MKIALIHREYRQSHLDRVIEQMREMGPPVIRAVWCEDRGFWAALEGCHRTRAALKLGLEPIIEPIEYRPGLTWANIGMGQDFVAGAITLGQVVEQAGREAVIGFGEDALPLIEDIPRPKAGEIMKYRIIKPIAFDFGGAIVGGVGTVFGSDDTAGKDVTDYVAMGYLEVVEPAPKVTKELTTENAPRRRGRKPKGSE